MTRLHATESPQVPVAQAGAVVRNEGSGRGPWIWFAACCTLFAASGLIRVYQDHRFETAKHRVIAPLFALKDLPARFGTWEAREGSESSLDPQISRIAGSADSVIRTYVDKLTGVTVTLLAVYGRTETTVAHTPQVCYPATGFELADDVKDMGLPLFKSHAIVRGTVYAKQGLAVDREEVYYTFRHNGKWSPSVEGNWRVLRFSPGIFKVQVQRRISETELRNLDNPTEQFLAAFLPEIEKLVLAAEASALNTNRPNGQVGG